MNGQLGENFYADYDWNKLFDTKEDKLRTRYSPELIEFTEPVDLVITSKFERQTPRFPFMGRLELAIDLFDEICIRILPKISYWRRRINILSKAVARTERINQMFSWLLSSYIHAHGLEPRILGELPPNNHPLF